MAADVLTQIMTARREQVAQSKKKVPLAEMKARAQATPLPRSFRDALHKRIASHAFAIISEIKRASPSAGEFAMHHDVCEAAKQYEAAGAAALSVLTEEQWFGGSIKQLQEVAQCVQLPILRKDFIMDEWQLHEARAFGASAILLIMAALTNDEVAHLAAAAKQLHLTVVAEAHDAEELQRALAIEDALVGINSRNLRDLSIDHETALSLHERVPKHRLAVAESGINNQATFARYRAASVRCFLMGEHFMRAAHVGDALAQWIEEVGIKEAKA